MFYVFVSIVLIKNHEYERYHDLYTCYNKKCKNIPAPLLIDPDVSLVLLQSLSANEFFTTGGICLLPGQIILCDQIGS